MKLSSLTYQVIGCAMEVHRHLGPGFSEFIYQRALAYELGLHRIPFVQEYEIPIYYKQQLMGKRRADFWIADCLPVEIKAVAEVSNDHLAQAINYLEASTTEIGLLINFGGPKLVHKRLYNTKLHPGKS